MDKFHSSLKKKQVTWVALYLYKNLNLSLRPSHQENSGTRWVTVESIWLLGKKPYLCHTHLGTEVTSGLPAWPVRPFTLDQPSNFSAVDVSLLLACFLFLSLTNQISLLFYTCACFLVHISFLPLEIRLLVNPSRFIQIKCLCCTLILERDVFMGPLAVKWRLPLVTCRCFPRATVALVGDVSSFIWI